MNAGADALYAHLSSGVTHVVRCWEVIRRDGQRLGFTDHDMDLVFDGLTFKAESGLTARALEQGTGLSVDNSEAMGALSDAALSEADIEAGRYDEAEVVAWLVNWQDVTARQVLFRGHIGEIRRAGGAFQAELRGLSDRLNRPVGRLYQRPCTAVLGDADCGLDLADAAFFWEGTLAGRQIILWEPFRAELAPGDRVRLTAGCDKRFATCRDKFANLVNFQGFPDIPGDDFLMASPSNSSAKGGGSRR